MLEQESSKCINQTEIPSTILPFPSSQQHQTPKSNKLRQPKQLSTCRTTSQLSTTDSERTASQVSSSTQTTLCITNSLQTRECSRTRLPTARSTQLRQARRVVPLQAPVPQVVTARAQTTSQPRMTDSERMDSQVSIPTQTILCITNRLQMAESRVTK